ncbi:MAG: BNR-4 repeat-containing protein [Prevotella sp.]|nr:BNR-4 repeat-containing protein [Prevotella sp.]
MRRFFQLTLFFITSVCAPLWADGTYSGHTMTDEGAWCWFADPRATHYQNDAGTINMSYIGYIDVHGNIKATQYNWITGARNEVLVRSYFQPDDHNNPTFLVLPDQRVLIIYSRHTDEPAFYYRVSKKAGDITSLGEEKKIVTRNNTTYPSPFIMSDDPTHWYLCWRGISWHPTIARLSLPDDNDDVTIEWGPYQMVQSTGARPYAKYYSNGKDKLYVTYTTGHPDNENPNWVYFNVININGGGEPTLEDINGNQLAVIKDGPFAVNKTAGYKNSYPHTVVDAPQGFRDWVWQIALDDDQHPVIAMVRINSDKSQHEYYYAKWTGMKWRLTDLADGGGRFHLSNTEYCYSGGEALDPQNPKNIYLSIPTNGVNGKVYEIWKYTLSDAGKVVNREQITSNSTKNNIRPFMLPDSQGSPLRLCWMNGDYYYWLVRTGYPLGYPTAIMCDYNWQAPEMSDSEASLAFSFSTTITMDTDNYAGTLMTLDNGITYSLDKSTNYPYVTIDGNRYNSQCQLYTSDNWATNCKGTNGDHWPTMLTSWNLSMTYDGQTLTIYRNGLIDQIIDTKAIKAIPTNEGTQRGCLPQWEIIRLIEAKALESIRMPHQAKTDIVLPTKAGGKAITWESSHPDIIDIDGTFAAPSTATEVSLKASTSGGSSTFTVMALPRDITQNLLAYYPFDDRKDASGNGYDLTLHGSAKANGKLDLTANAATAFASNGYAIVPASVMDSLRSYTILLEATPRSLLRQPRLYDFGYDSGNSLFLRANTLAAGIKYAGGTTTMTAASTQLEAGTTYRIAVTFDARTRITTIYVDGNAVGSDMNNRNEAYMISSEGTCHRNYLGRTQWWDTNAASDNGDYVGTIDELRIYNIALTQKEVCQLQGLPFDPGESSSEFLNGNMEGSYTPMTGAGVSADRAIYIPENWNVEYLMRNENDLNALKTGDLYFSQFFAGRKQNPNGGSQTMWIRQRWGESSLGFYQQVLLPQGNYTLTADAYSSDASTATYVYAGTAQQSPSLADCWQTIAIPFTSDGTTPQKIGFATVHASTDGERICAFDNFIITADEQTSIHGTPAHDTMHKAIYDLSGRRLNHIPTGGIYLQNGKKRYFGPTDM